jgi:GH25 family lysozyme M1 (1,4-beta-N-acetylmuramidase)
MHRRIQRPWLPLLAAMFAALIVLPSLATEVDAASTKWSAKCAANVRTAPHTYSRILRTLKSGATVTAVATVTADHYTSKCAGGVSSRQWLKITAINGKSTKSLYGRTYAYVAKRLFKYVSSPSPTPTPTPTPTPATATLVSNCSVRLRSSPTTDANTTSIIDENTVVTASTAVDGGTWSADCGATVAGSDWYKITAVGGTSVSSLYGTTEVYAASGLFRTAAQSNYVEGIDVSKWQGVINWPMVRAAGKQFAITKATEGVGYKDGQYDANKAGAMASDIAFGAYHFARPDLNSTNTGAVAEADWFVDTAAYEPGMIIPTLDLERSGGKSSAALISWVKSWVGRVYERLGVKPMIYASPSFWQNNMANTSWFADNGYDVLWIAPWGVTSPSVPGNNWGGKSWTFWQYSDNGIVPGISGGVDLDRYRLDSFDAVTYGGG